jgi:hypothetical protein
MIVQYAPTKPSLFLALVRLIAKRCRTHLEYKAVQQSQGCLFYQQAQGLLLQTFSIFLLPQSLMAALAKLANVDLSRAVLGTPASTML